MSTAALARIRGRRGDRRAISGPTSAALARRPELLVILALAGALNLWALDLNGYANGYYSATVRSMSESWHAFLYGSFDVAGVQTVDKPPLAFWIQALSARAFGFSSWSLLVPQALMGVATVGLVYDTAVRRFGRPAAATAGLALALTPIAVAMSRHNNPDALLTLTTTAAVWATVRGLDPGTSHPLRWLLAAGAFVGLAFETKMAAGLLVVPGIALAWFVVAPAGRIAALRQLLAGGAVMTLVGLAWPVLMWLTPAANRPYISGTDDNSIWSLILGYNGLGRVFGQSGAPDNPGGGGGGGGSFGGETGIGRLLNQSLGGQAGWLIGFALVAIVVLAVATRARRSDARTGFLIATGGAFLVTAVTFSRAEGIFHPYYVAALAPFTALLVGAGVSFLLGDDRRARLGGAAMLLAGAGTEAIVIANGAIDLQWATGLIAAASVAAALAIVVASSTKVRRAAVAAAVAILLAAPASWAVQTPGHATSSTFPAGGPASAQGMGGGPGGRGAPGDGGDGFRARGGGPGPVGPDGGAPPTGVTRGPGGGMFGGATSNLAEAVAHAKANGGGTVIVASQSGASALITESAADVAGIGGFSGRETEVTADWLADAVEDGRVRWVLAGSSGQGGGMADGRAGASTAMAIVEQVGRTTAVDGLYDLQGLADELRAAAAA